MTGLLTTLYTFIRKTTTRAYSRTRIRIYQNTRTVEVSFNDN